MHAVLIAALLMDTGVEERIAEYRKSRLAELREEIERNRQFMSDIRAGRIHTPETLRRGADRVAADVLREVKRLEDEVRKTENESLPVYPPLKWHDPVQGDWGTITSDLDRWLRIDGLGDVPNSVVVVAEAATRSITRQTVQRAQREIEVSVYNKSVPPGAKKWLVQLPEGTIVETETVEPGLGVRTRRVGGRTITEPIRVMQLNLPGVWKIARVEPARRVIYQPAEGRRASYLVAGVVHLEKFEP